MALRILDSPSDPEGVARELCRAIERAIPDATVEVTPGGAGHFELRVTSPSFAGQSAVEQQQRVYASIAHLMRGDAAPVHAIDRLRTLVPGP